MSVVRGKDFKMYRNTDDPYDDSPTWSEVVNVRDLTRNREKDLADASIRGSTYHLQVATLKTLTVDFQMVYAPDDVDIIAFEQAYEDDSDVEILCLDGSIDVADSKGIRFMAQVSKFTTNEALGDVGLVDVTLTPGYTPLNLPRRVHVVTPGSVVDL
jgi:hypothetical protein